MRKQKENRCMNMKAKITTVSTQQMLRVQSTLVDRTHLCSHRAVYNLSCFESNMFARYIFSLFFLRSQRAVDAEMEPGLALFEPKQSARKREREEEGENRHPV